MSATPTSTPRARNLPALDTLRAVGALAVLTTHVGFRAGTYESAGLFGHLVARMDVGVAVFFVLSGFLLSRAWFLRARDGESPPSALVYLRKRFWRIYPVYAVVSLLVLVLLPANHELGPAGWSSTLLLTDIYVADQLPEGFTQTWSLATEVAFYLALPLVMRAVLGRRPEPRRMIGVLAALVAANVVWVLHLSALVPGDPPMVSQWLPSYLTWFVAGIFVALAATTPAAVPRAARAFRSLAASPGSCWLGALGLLLVASTPLAGPLLLEPATPAQALTKNLLYTAVALLVLLPGALPREGSRFDAAMTHPWARHLGHISYSLFLVHVLVLELVMRATGFPLFGGNFLAILVLTLSFSLVASELLYRLVELPSLRRKASVRPGSGPVSASTTTAETPSTTA